MQMIRNNKKRSIMPLFGISFELKKIVSIPRHLKSYKLCKCISRTIKENQVSWTWTLGVGLSSSKGELKRNKVNIIIGNNLSNLI